MNTSTLNAGDTITTVCTRCKDITGHVIMAMVAAQIIKVQCKACGSEHKYRPPVSQKAQARTATVKRGRGDEGSRVKAASSPARMAANTRAENRAMREAAHVLEAWMQALGEYDERDATPYAMTCTYSVGQLVSHPTFGIGKVQRLTGAGKVEILFRQGLKLLRCLS